MNEVLIIRMAKIHNALNQIMKTIIEKS